MLPCLREITPIFKKLLQQGGNDFIGVVLQYIIESAEISDKVALIELINTNISYEIGEKIMTAVEQWKQEGEFKGISDERNKIALRMLAEGSDISFVIKVTGLTTEQIKTLQKKEGH